MIDDSFKIAIIGMAGRFPGAANLDAFWNNLQRGISGGKQHSANNDELVRYGFSLDGRDAFDADFFEIPAREAKVTDPQHRLFLECAYEALEHAGVAPKQTDVVTGVFGSCNFNTYILPFAEVVRQAKPIELLDMLVANDKDYLTSRVAYKLDLKGPALIIQSACSSSLASVVVACQSILSGQCDMALAGGVGLKNSSSDGYPYEPEGPLSCDGHVRAYSDDASGVNEGEGVGVVVLKRYEDAKQDGDSIYAVIAGFGIGNDGSDKAGFHAPSVSGQIAAITDALSMSGVDPLEIGYVEGHGTGTPIGDPMEVAALSQAWNIPASARRQYCYLGSVKTGIGHLNAAAGVASLIKTALALHYKTIPASLDFRSPNPRLAFETTPFKVADKTVAWTAKQGRARKAAVHSLGIGGNNVHLILEEGPDIPNTASSDVTLMTVSARTETALKNRLADLARWADRQPEISLADVAHTLLMGRDGHRWRTSFVCETPSDFKRLLQSPELSRKAAELADVDKDIPLAFLFPGAGSHYAGMTLELRDTVAAYRDVFDRVCGIFKEEVHIDVLEVVRNEAAMGDAVCGTAALFCAEYSLARLLVELGMSPSYVMGYSAGEYAAATVANIFSERDAVRVITERARIIDSSPEGAMLFVAQSQDDIRPRLSADISIAAVIGPKSCVVSGSVEGIGALERSLLRDAVPSSRIAVTKAGHSPLLEQSKTQLRNVFNTICLNAPSIPVLSNVTGSWLTDDEAVNPEYWVSQMRNTVQLSDQIHTLCAAGQSVVLEVGPSRKLSAMLRRHPAFRNRSPVIPVMPAEQSKTSEKHALLEAIGLIWQQGARAGWSRIDTLNGGGHSVALPTYPFEKKEFAELSLQKGAARFSSGLPSVSNICWQEILLDTCAGTPAGTPVSISTGIYAGTPADSCSRIAVLGGTGFRLAEQIRQKGWSVAVYASLADLQTTSQLPDVLIDYRFINILENGLEAAATVCQQAVELCAWLSESADGNSREVYWVTSGAAQFGSSIPYMTQSVLLGPARVLPFEANHTFGCVVDIAGSTESELADILVKAIGSHMAQTSLTSVVTARDGMFWQEAPSLMPARSSPERHSLTLRNGASYLIFGGSGGIGRTFMEELAQQAARQQCRITLIPVQRSLRPVEYWQDLQEQWVTVTPLYIPLNEIKTLIEGIQAIEAQCGKVAGIVHASGVPGGGLMQVQSHAVCHFDNWNAKVLPLTVVEHIMANNQVDFVILNSSVGALCGALGQLDNMVANIVMDAWACQHATTVPLVKSIRWDVWHQVGMINKMAALHERLSGERMNGGVTPKQARAVLEQCLFSKTPLPVVTGGDLYTLLNEARHKRGMATGTLEATDLKAESCDAARPALSVVWRGARHALDVAVLDIFEDRLGIQGIGIDDDYVELGGDSLMAMSLAKDIRELLSLQTFTVAQIFRLRTVAGIADALAKTPEEKERLFALAELLGGIKRMAPEQVARSLEEVQ